MALLNQIGQIESNLIGTRILPLEGQTPLPIETGSVYIEHTFRGEGSILSKDLSETFTSKSIFRRGEWAKPYHPPPPPPSQISGFYESQSNGIMIIKADGERISWVGHGIGLAIDYKSSKHQGVIFLRTESAALANKFNGLVVYVETSIAPVPPNIIRAIRKFWHIVP